MVELLRSFRLQCLTAFTILIMLACHTHAQADPIIIKGNRFFHNSSESEFIAKGLSYGRYVEETSVLENSEDLLSSVYECERDVRFLKQLGINLLDVDVINPRQDYSKCMRVLSQQGIYILITMNPLQDRGINEWTTTIFNGYREYIDRFSGYDNVLGFMLHTYEPIHANYSRSFADIKAKIRDLKDYIKEKNYRAIPIGIRPEEQSHYTRPDRQLAMDYWTCNSSLPDFFAPVPHIDHYSCATYETYINLFSSYTNTTIPTIILPWPCQSRYLSDIDSIFDGKQFSPFSGIIFDRYFEISNTNTNSTRGLMRFIPARQVEPLPIFQTLSAKLATRTPKIMKVPQMTITATNPSCPTPDTNWKASNTLPPKPFEKLCTCMMNSLRCVASTETVNWLLQEDKSNKTHTYSRINEICEKDTTSDCAGIRTNKTAGNYGAFSMCNATETFSFALNGYWKRHGNSSCTAPIVGLNNLAMLRDRRNDTDEDCAFLLKQVGENGLGTLTATARAAEKTPATGDSGNNKQGNGVGNNSTGLSLKIKLAIGLSVTFCFIAGLLFVLYLLHRKKKRARIAAAQNAENSYERKEIDGTPIDGPTPLSEVPGKQIEAFELPAEKPIPEIVSPVLEIPGKQNEAVELPTDKVAHEIDSKEIKAGGS